MLSMKQIKGLLRKEFEALGYTCNISKFTQFVFNNPIANLSGVFEISSANAKRFEVKIYADKDGFNVPCREDTSGNNRWFAAKRFTKKPSVIRDCMDWIASATSEHATLYELLHPEMPLPEPNNFSDGTFMAGRRPHDAGAVYPGMCEKAAVQDIIAMIGRRVVHAVYNPRQTPLFCVKVKLRHAQIGDYGNSFAIATDGEKWYPLQIFRDEYRVFPEDKLVRRLSAMNENDKQLIHAACREYVRRNFSDIEE